MTTAPDPQFSLQHDIFARACDARDPRFDGVFFVGITTTRIYCRPGCPARVSYRDRRRFFRSAAAAERGGFRPCLRCRPELAPGRALMDAVPRLARAAVHRIAAGALNGHTVAELARELGVSERHLRRALERELGVSPLELAQTHRLLLAKQLLADTPLAVTRIAYASGFQSLRRFNAAFLEQYRMAPSAIRRAPRGHGSARPASHEDAPVQLSLGYREPFDWDALLAFFRRDAVEGIEVVADGRYGRTIQVGGRCGYLLVENVRAGKGADPGGRGRVAHESTFLNVAVSLSLVPVLMPLLARLRQLFDLDAEPTVIDRHLAQAGLAAQIERHPGLRIPGAVDGFDVALRALLRGRTRGRTAFGDKDPARRVAWALGEPIETGVPGLSRLAPTAASVVEAGTSGLEALGVPARRAQPAVALARMVAEGTLRLEPGSDVGRTRRALLELDGVGDQVAATIVMRALYWPDAFSTTDRTLQRAAGVATASALRDQSEQWGPWRAYAALHLSMDDEVRPDA